MTAAVDRQPVVFAGLPAGSWAFAIRIWVAVVVALYVSFWLELEAASSAGLTVAVLALPTRGQGAEKAVFRLLATVVGVAASLTIVGIFTQSDVLLVAFAAWIGLCVYTAGLLDGNRAYAAALCVTTIALIAINQIDTPQQVFESGVARGAAICVGVIAVTFINDILAAPDYHPKITAQLEGLHRRIVNYAQSVVSGQAVPATMAATLLGEITAMRPDIASLAAESSGGQARSAAARAAMVGMVAELWAARAFAALCIAAPPGARIEAAFELDRSADPVVDSAILTDREEGSSDLTEISLAWSRRQLLQRHRDVRSSLAALRAGNYPVRQWRAPLYRSHRIAAENGIRAAIYFALASIFFVMAGWTTTDVSLSLVAVLIGLGATVPNIQAFTMLAAVTTPIACLMAFLLEFVVLDGVTDFPLLAIGLAPFIIGFTLLMTLQNQVLASVGRLNLIFIIALFAPSNPQTYDPQAFIFACFLACTGTSLLFAIQTLIPPLSNDRRLQLLLERAHADLAHLDLGGDRRLALEEFAFRDAWRVGQIAGAAGTSRQYLPALDQIMACFDRAAALRLCDVELSRLTNGPLADVADAACGSLVWRDAGAMRASAKALRDAASAYGVDATAACAALVLASAVFTPPSVTTFVEVRTP